MAVCGRLLSLRTVPRIGFNSLINHIRWSSQAPSYSSRGSLSRAVTSLGLPRISTMIITGKPNRPFPEKHGVDIDTFSEGAAQAIGVVTSCLANGDYDSLGGLLSDQCIAGLREQLSSLSPEQRQLIHTQPDDIFFTFIPIFMEADSVQRLLFVTFSFPSLGEIKEKIELRTEFRKKFDQEMRDTLAQAKDLDKEQLNDALKAKVDAGKELLREYDVNALFRDNEIVIGNFLFERQGQDSDWTITELTQVNSVDAWAWIFRKRWKGRLGLSIRGVDFYKILRIDYFTDWMALSLIISVISTSTISGGMMPPGGGPGLPPTGA